MKRLDSGGGARKPRASRSPMVDRRGVEADVSSSGSGVETGIENAAGYSSLPWRKGGGSWRQIYLAG